MRAINTALTPNPFNRTTMELKLHSPLSIDNAAMFLLIEPLWNWNPVPAPALFDCQRTFNRTTMELKRGMPPPSLPNWGAFNRTTMELKQWIYQRWWCRYLSFNRTTMELKLGKNSSPSSSSSAFNRTTMELKPNHSASQDNPIWILLIEPLWNWNSKYRWSFPHVPHPFNRTTMELKLFFSLWKGLAKRDF